MRTTVIPLLLLFFSFDFNTAYSQAPDLGAATDFAMFTAAGAFTNDGATVVTGDIGTNTTPLTGFPPGIVIGNIHISNGITAAAAADVPIAYTFLDALTCGTVLGTTLGSGQILTPDIYCLGAASTLNGNLTLDAEGDPDAIFIFQIDGALSTTTLSSIMLINGASLCNVYWQINGAVSLGENSLFQGTMLVNGAISLLEGATLFGRGLSQAGAIDMHDNIVTVGFPPIAAIIIPDGPTEFCEGESVVLSGNIDGTWNTGSTSGSITVSESGSYFVINTTICGSDTSNIITVIVNPLPVCTISGETTFCEGDSSELCASAGAASYLWSTGSTDECITVTEEGTYFVTITDSNGCSSTCNTSVLVNDLPVCTISGETTFCEGESSELCASPGATSYLWDTGATTECITVSLEGSYSVTITDANGCSSTCDETIIVNQPPVCTITGETTICEGESSELCASPGAAGYLWSTGATTECITVSLEGTYSVTITDVNGCTSTCDETIIVNQPPVCAITGETIICEGGSTILCATGGAFSYLWSTGATTECITVSLEGTYSVTVTGANGCSSVCSETVNVNSSLVCTITGELNLCEGSSTLLCVPAGALSYLWSTGGTSNCITVTQEGLYSVTITFSGGCSSTCSETVIVNPLPVCTISGETTFCEGGSSELCASPGAAGYLWSTGATTECITVSLEGTYSVTITDANGCTSFCDETIIVNQPPVCAITGETTFCEGESSELCASPGAAGYLWSTGATTECITVSLEGTYTVTVTDANGCSSVCSETVIVNSAPVCTITGVLIICEGSSTILCVPAGALSYIWNTGQTTNCISVNTAGTFSVTITFAGGCTSTCSAEVIITPGTPLAITCPADITIECGENTFPGNTGTATTSGNCNVPPTVDYSDITTSGTCPQEYSIIRTWIATDASGNSVSCEQAITIEDSISPSISCPPDVSVQCSSAVPPVNTVGIIASDNCGGTTTVTFIGDVISNQTCVNRFTVTRTYRATDECGNSSDCNQTITVFDSTLPLLACPANVTVQCASLVPSPDPGAPITSDNCGGTPMVTFVGDVITNQTCVNRYTITRTYRATDACGNSTDCDQTITVFDSTLPLLTCPANVTVQCASLVPSPDPGAPITSDNCGGTPMVIFVGDVITNQTCVNRYTITRTYRATDACGNSTDCNQTITVFDSTLPLLTCPANVTVQCASLVPSPDPGALITSDNCGGTPMVTFIGDVITNQTCVNRYTITRTYRATDACGNSTDCNQTITVFDSTLPLLTCPANVTVQCASLVPSPDPGALITSDNCGGTPMVTFIGDVITNQTCVNRYTITRTYRATDACGNSTDCNQTITVFDNTAPIILCPANVTVQCASLVPPVNISGVISSDNCGGTTTNTHVGDVITNMTCVNRFILTRTYRTIDECGNSATCAQVITVFDNTQPAINCPANVTVQCAGQVPPVNLASVVTSDNCGGTTIVTLASSVITNQTCANRFILTRTYQSTDACGNSATCVQVITVFDNTPPSIDLTDLGVPNGGTIEVQCQGQDPDWDLPVFDEGSIDASDNCGGNVIITFNQVLENEGNCSVDGYILLYRLNWTAIDACGNSSTAFAFLALIDTIPPVIHGVPADITINCDEIPEPPVVIYATDECLCACVVLFEQTIPISGCQDEQVITRSWTARDECGNETIEIQNITLIDDQGPELLIILPEIANITDGSILNYTCNEGGFPGFLNLLNAESAISPVTCGGAAVITFQRDIIIANNCEFFGFVEQQTFRWEGVDLCGNETSFTLIARLIDNEAPILLGVPDTVCIGDLSLDLVDASDNCGSPSIRFWDVSILNPCGAGMALRRTYEAYDDCGNIATDTTILIPNDQTLSIEFANPVLADLEDGEILMVDCASNTGNYTSFGINDVSIEEVCRGGSSISFSEIIIENSDDLIDGIIAIIELHWLATDVCGNSSELVVTAHIINQSGGAGPIFFNFESGITIGCNEDMPEILAFDNSGGEITLTIVESLVLGVCTFEYDVLRVITATDKCGRSTTKSQSIHVGGDGPVIEGVDLEICDDLTIPEVTAYDECAGEFVEVAMEEDTLDIPCHDGLVIERTWTATDSCGNETVIIQTIIVNDHTPPEILIPSYSVIHRFMDNSSNSIFYSQTDLMDRLDALNGNSLFVTDGCDLEIIPVLSVDTIMGDCQVDGFFERRIYTWVATDVCVNTASVSFSVNIIDDIPPVIIGLPNDTTLICVPLGLPPMIHTQDLAQPITIIYTESIEEGEIPGTFIVIRRWLATDDCGNTSEVIQRINWIPDTFLECDIIVPPLVDCNSHGVVIGSLLAGGIGIISYDWEIVGEKCFIQGGQGTPEIIIYVGFSDVKIILTVTDEFGCVSMCMTTINCLDASGIPLVNLPGQTPIISTPQLTELENIEKPELLYQLSIWPNPVSSTINVDFESVLEKEITISFLNILGQPVLNNEIIAKKGFNSYKLDVSILPKGSYMIQIKTGDELHSRVIIRQ